MAKKVYILLCAITVVPLQPALCDDQPPSGTASTGIMWCATVAPRSIAALRQAADYKHAPHNYKHAPRTTASMPRTTVARDIPISTKNKSLHQITKKV